MAQSRPTRRGACTRLGQLRHETGTRLHEADSIGFTAGSARHARRLTLVVGLAVAAFLFGIIPSLAAAESFHAEITSADAARQAAEQDPNRGTLSLAARRAIDRGYLVPDQARYDRQKARLTRRAAGRETLTDPVSALLAPAIVAGRSWQGINNPNVAPPDETSAVGTTRYIELVNVNFAIYNKTSNTPISTGSINSLVGAASTDSVFDVQVLWDPTTSRFYYAADDVVSSSDNRLAFGFSKTASPSSAADWCKYSIGFGSVFPDYPKLGDSRLLRDDRLQSVQQQRLVPGLRPAGDLQAARGDHLPGALELQARRRGPPDGQRHYRGVYARRGERDRHQGDGLCRGPARVTAGDPAVAVQGHQGRNDRRPAHSKHRNAGDGSELYVARGRTADGVGQPTRHPGRQADPGRGRERSRAER